ncbi:hypothetical protein SEA_BOOSTSEASON_3 [Mycobacterium phage BoostSeason]|uniref:Terminase small subunit n=3 Tax=Timquatrovirus TaxID=1623306 RepID=A0A0M4RA01_9CAUD|nr:terminase small subunit [Mycobacterium phage ZoeJ]YP_009125477.1 terminase small subunit [Mycobacterium phage Milly]YP_009195249.1 terminase small subunit [Mycobacterium phage Mufasa]YP_009951089.1 terminase small subunit [Mycobacterium phage Findley]AOZ64342.1 hypothetical protein SEA_MARCOLIUSPRIME_3 [Mycobacterium phage Marcoliusprime]ASR86548.1 hypothetical protein SEA_DISMALFUNK_3 [Mycobacterium phage DismalFunk]AYB68958.1 hypothetical protein SEA_DISMALSTRESSOR_3 [Mycobacterium phage
MAVKSVAAAAADGDRRELLVAMRARVATAVEDPETPARDLAALTRRLLEIANEIAAIDAQAEQGEGSVAAAAATPDEPFSTA